VKVTVRVAMSKAEAPATTGPSALPSRSLMKSLEVAVEMAVSPCTPASIRHDTVVLVDTSPA
jgi:hypothetical protein